MLPILIFDVIDKILENKKAIENQWLIIGDPRGIRTPVTAVKEMLSNGLKGSMSDDTYLRWAKKLLETDGVLIGVLINRNN